MPVLPSLTLGIRALGEAIQLTSLIPLQAILSTSRDILQAAKSVDRDRIRLAQFVLDITVAYSDGVRKLDGIGCDDDEFKSMSDDLLRCLETVSRTLQDKPKRGFVTRAIGRSATEKTLKGCEADLSHISSLFETQIQLRNSKLSEGIALEATTEATEKAMEERFAQAHRESIDLIKSQVVKQSRKKLQRSSFGHLPPAASPIFFGRSHHVSHIVESLGKVPAYHAILGPAGIGKTSVALNILHDPRVLGIYGKHRYFLACETTVDADGIIAGISDIFSLNERSFMKAFKRVCQIINSSMLFLLDNFETPWERGENRQKVEELLAQLSDIPNLSIVVTLRGAERPYGIQWSRPFLPVLEPLDFDAACQTFVAISDVSDKDADMIKLLEEVEGIPLAITLLGAQAQYASCALLLEQWRICKT